MVQNLIGNVTVVSTYFIVHAAFIISFAELEFRSTYIPILYSIYRSHAYEIIYIKITASFRINFFPQNRFNFFVCVLIYEIHARVEVIQSDYNLSTDMS